MDRLPGARAGCRPRRRCPRPHSAAPGGRRGGPSRDHALLSQWPPPRRLLVVAVRRAPAVRPRRATVGGHRRPRPSPTPAPTAIARSRHRITGPTCRARASHPHDQLTVSTPEFPCVTAPLPAGCTERSTDWIDQSSGTATRARSEMAVRFSRSLDKLSRKDPMPAADGRLSPRSVRRGSRITTGDHPDRHDRRCVRAALVDITISTGTPVIVASGFGDSGGRQAGRPRTSPPTLAEDATERVRHLGELGYARAERSTGASVDVGGEPLVVRGVSYPGTSAADVRPNSPSSNSIE